MQPPDSSSNTSSCNSSTPSSPAVQQTHTPHSNLKAQFHFPGEYFFVLFQCLPNYDKKVVITSKRYILSNNVILQNWLEMFKGIQNKAFRNSNF